MVELTPSPIDTSLLLKNVSSHAAGAMVLFVGTTREFTAGRRTLSLDYECYPEMAVKKLEELEAEARHRWPIVECHIVHRLGRIELGEASIAIAVSSPHRQVAFDAAHWLIDTIKQVVPIWKQENWADGSSEWVHPMATEQQRGMEPNSKSHYNLLCAGLLTPHSPATEGLPCLLAEIGEIGDLRSQERCGVRRPAHNPVRKGNDFKPGK